MLQISPENLCVGVSFQQSCRPEGLQLCLKETTTKVFSYDFWKILKNTYFEEHLRTTASVLPDNSAS